VDENEAMSKLRQTAVRLTKRQSRVTRTSKRVTMRDEDKKISARAAYVSDDSGEYEDQVEPLPGQRVSNALFDSTLE